MEVDDVDQANEYENVNDTIHTNNQHEIQMADQDCLEDEEHLQGRAKQKASCSYAKGNSIGRRKKLRITSTVSSERIEDHIDNDHVEDHHIFETQGHQTNEIQGKTLDSLL